MKIQRIIVACHILVGMFTFSAVAEEARMPEQTSEAPVKTLGTITVTSGQPIKC
ncbi:MAG: hypothetical protein ABL865_05860 [Candidatus Nitrotoga sp.]